ncbi:hypothetical protein [Skermania piniformis]|uniref:Uncharacterized protein n=1 Tax=Skermania pinensis TaxID=39122 RepID=A0ABX8SGT9_9ACTN|nr:hypothetical protein [Skermania piniformis]QXQ14896.1 hypothetical protein KV203_05810 [Skermania piniformis]
MRRSPVWRTVPVVGVFLAIVLVIVAVRSGHQGSAGDPDGDPVEACPAGARCGTEQVAGLGARKQEILAAGGTVSDLAVAMLETTAMRADRYPPGDGKTGDAANFGIFKQNWLMLRSACDRFAGQARDEYRNGSVLNDDLAADLACLHQSRRHYGIGDWFAGQRHGATGLQHPDTADIVGYRAAVGWIRTRLRADPTSTADDTRYWVHVPAI